MKHKIKNVFLGVLMTSMVFSALPADAQTNQDMQAQIAALLAQIQALTAQINGNTAVNAVSFSRDLTVGSSGADVASLQKFLNSKGFTVSGSGAGSPGNESVYFGPATQSALARFQSAHNISPAVGYFGPTTRAAVNSMTTATPPVTTPPVTVPPTAPTSSNPGLSGGAGSIDEYAPIARLSNEEVGESQKDVHVAGLEIRADSGSDIRLAAVRLVMNEGTATRRFNRYAKDVSLWLDGKEVARVNASEFTDNNNWTKTISLDERNTVIRKGKTADLIVAVSGIDRLDSNDLGQTWTVDVRQVRFTDAQGASITEDPNTSPSTFSFESFASAMNAEMRIALERNGNAINDAHIIQVGESSRTDNVELLSFSIEARGNADLMINKLPVLLSTTEAAGNDFDDPDDVITNVSLWMDGTKIASKSLSTDDANDDSETVLFDRLNLRIRAGQRSSFLIKVDLVAINKALDNGDTVRAQITSTERNDIDVEDASGRDLPTAKRAGTGNADAHAVYDAGIRLEFLSASEVRSYTASDPGQSDRAEFRITFRATSFGQDMRLDRSCEDEAVNGSGDAGEGAVFSISGSSATVITCSLGSTNSDSEDNGLVYEVDEGTTRTFTLLVVVEGNDDFVNVELKSVNWGTAQDNSNDNFYNFNLDKFRTNQLFLNTI